MGSAVLAAWHLDPGWPPDSPRPVQWASHFASQGKQSIWVRVGSNSLLTSGWCFGLEFLLTSTEHLVSARPPP